MNRKIKMRRGFWISVALLIAWMGITQGIYSIGGGTAEFFAILGLALGVSAVILALLPAVMERLSALEIEAWRLTLSIGVILVFALSAVFGGPSIDQISPLDSALFIIQRVGRFVLIEIVIWQMVRSVRQSAVDPQ